MNGFAMSDDISFHFNPRRQSREVVMNSRFGGAWQVEEKLSLPPVFWTNRPFEVKIETKRNKFVVHTCVAILQVVFLGRHNPIVSVLVLEDYQIRA
jgi:hypothetical protein